MIENFREILKGPAGKIIAVMIVLAGLALVMSEARDSSSESPEACAARDRVFFCFETFER